MYTYLEGLTELVAHNVVQQRIDAGGQKIQYTGCVIKYVEIIVKGISTAAGINQRDAIDSHQTLGVKGSPAEKERNGYSYCKKGGVGYQMTRIRCVYIYI